MVRTYSADEWRRLGHMVWSERNRIGLGETTEWAAKVGRSTRVLLGLERGEAQGKGTLALVEEALGWENGSAWQVLEGGEPTKQSGQLPGITMSATGSLSHGTGHRERPVGLGLDDDAADLPDEDVESIRAHIQSLRRARGIE